jgi:hypothetical protein
VEGALKQTQLSRAAVASAAPPGIVRAWMAPRLLCPLADVDGLLLKKKLSTDVVSLHLLLSGHRLLDSYLCVDFPCRIHAAL